MTTMTTNTINQNARTLLVRELLAEHVTHYDLHLLLSYYRTHPVQYTKTGSFPTLPMLLATLTDLRKETYTTRYTNTQTPPPPQKPTTPTLSTAKSLVTFMSKDTARHLFKLLPPHAKQTILNFHEPNPSKYASRAELRTKLYIALHPNDLPPSF